VGFFVEYIDVHFDNVSLRIVDGQALPQADVAFFRKAVSRHVIFDFGIRAVTKGG
jgi:hypothetical protein